LAGIIFGGWVEKDIGGLAEQVGHALGWAVRLGLVIQDTGPEAGDVQAELADGVFFPHRGVAVFLFIFHWIGELSFEAVGIVFVELNLVYIATPVFKRLLKGGYILILPDRLPFLVGDLESLHSASLGLAGDADAIPEYAGNDADPYVVIFHI
jgi:hypothetical protein